MVAMPLAGLLAAAKAVEGVFEALRRDGSSLAAQDRMLAFGEMNALVGPKEKYQREKEWLE